MAPTRNFAVDPVPHAAPALWTSALGLPEPVEEPSAGSLNRAAAGNRLSRTKKLLDLVEREQIKSVVFGHDGDRWESLKKSPEYYE